MNTLQKGYDFFDHWDFYHYEDPTHGLVDYVDAKTAWRENLVGFTEDGNAFMRVDTTPKVQDLRKSIRLESKTNNIPGGLLISSITKSPYGCGVWYAWWLTGQEVWPDQGEIDILEGVNEYTENQSSFHTARGCQLSSSSEYTGTVTLSGPLGQNCASAETNNEGCGIVDPQAPLGPEFNEKKGGVYAMLWNENGISTWFFPRQKVPKDIYADDPSPSKWGKPLAHLSSDNCDIGKYFYDHNIIFDITLGGDWAGNPTEWHKKGISGQTESCANITGYDNANDYILNEGESFENAVFEIEYVKIYQ